MANAIVAAMLQPPPPQSREPLLCKSDDFTGNKKDDMKEIDFYFSLRIGAKEIGEGSSIEEVTFDKDSYKEELQTIGRYLCTFKRPNGLADQEFKRLWRKSYRFFLQNRQLWKLEKKKEIQLLTIVENLDDKMKIIIKSHHLDCAGHRGIWATFKKIREIYNNKNIYLQFLI